MKKLFFISLWLTFTSIHAQITLTKKQTGAQINNGDIVIFNTVGDAAASLDFYVNNNSATQIKSKIEFVSAVNADGTGMELCYGSQCLSDITVGDTYPSTGPVIIPANGRNGNFDHFYNTHVGNGATQDYVFRFFIVDNSGNEIGNSISFTYRYQPAMATNSFDKLSDLGIQLKSNIIDNQLEITVVNELKLEIFDTNGKSILNKNLTSGNNTINSSMLNSGVYFLSFLTDSGQKATAKIVKQ